MQARQEPLYKQPFEIPDTLDGRFDSLCLHLYLALRPLNHQSAYDSFRRRLIEHFITDMDQSMRAIGVGETRIGRQVTHMAQAFHGRARAYDLALQGAGDLEDCLAKNLLAYDRRSGVAQSSSVLEGEAKGTMSRSGQLKALASYVQRVADLVDKQIPAHITQGLIEFPDLSPEHGKTLKKTEPS